MEFSGQDAVAVVALAVVGVKVLGPIAAALAERIRGSASSADAAALATDVDYLRARLAEVEERLDFAERLLAQGRESAQLPEGAGP